MSSLFSAAQKYAHWLTFVLLEIVAFTLIIGFNQSKRDIFLHSSSVYAGSIVKQTAQISDYLRLKDSNEELLAENARLLRELISQPRSAPTTSLDSTEYPYEVMPAYVVNNGILSIRNHFTIDRGRRDGIDKSMGIVTSDGVVGITKQSSNQFTLALSLANTDIRLSATIEDQEYFGTVSWDGGRYDRLRLTGIPKYAPISRGQRVVTNGYSTIFPPGLDIGVVDSYRIDKNGAFYEVTVTPSADVSQLGYVYVLKDNFAAERAAVETNE
ncbi:MAG: rod shape-determining protein MreC [Bacteroidota bacterium]